MKLCVAPLFGLAVLVSPRTMPRSQFATECTLKSAIPVEQLDTYGYTGVDFSDVTDKGHSLLGAGSKEPSRARSLLSSRDRPFTCGASEMCLSLAGDPFCYDVITGDFVDIIGTTGNAISGDYELADGRKGNWYKGPYPMPTAIAQNSPHSATELADSAQSNVLAGMDGPTTSESMSSAMQMPTQTEISPTTTIAPTAAIATTAVPAPTATMENAAVTFAAGSMLQKLLLVVAVAMM